VSRRERSYCRGCQKQTGWTHAGQERPPLQPPTDYWRCETCGMIRAAYGTTIPDSEGLCRAVLDANLRARGAGRATAVDQPISFDGLDYTDALGQLQLSLWVLYCRYDQTAGAGTGTLLGYATVRLRNRLTDWYRNQHLIARRGGQEGAPHVVSLNELVDGGDDPSERELGAALGNGVADAGSDRSPDLARALARGRRLADGDRRVDDRRTDAEPPERDPATDRGSRGRMTHECDEDEETAA
jgi:hypothetical protein